MSTEESGAAPSKFVSQAELNDAQKRREKDIQDAIGEAPPEAPKEEAYDPRPLYERLQEAKAIQDEKLEEMFKLRNQFRGLDESESQFLADIEEARRKREWEKRREDASALEAFRKATVTKTTPAAPAVDKSTVPVIPKSKPRASLAKRKRDNALGIVRKTPGTPTEKPTKIPKSTEESENPTKDNKEAPDS